MPMSASNTSGGLAPRRTNAAAPSATVTTSIGSSANVCSMTRRTVRLWSARRSVFRTLRLLAGAHVGRDEFHDSLHGRARQEDSIDPDRPQLRHVHVRDDPPDYHEHVGEALLVQQFHDTRADVIVCARQDGEADHVGVLLERGAHDLFGALAKPG